MVSGTIEELKSFMSLLLKGELFDSWEVIEAKVETFFETTKYFWKKIIIFLLMGSNLGLLAQILVHRG